MFTEFRDVESLEIASVFWDMAVEEKRHSGILQGKYKERYGNASCSLTEEDLQDMIEVPKLERWRRLRAGRHQQSARANGRCRSHCAAEKSAQRFYSQLVEQTQDGPLRRLYNELATWKTGTWRTSQNMLAADDWATTGSELIKQTVVDSSLRDFRVGWTIGADGQRKAASHAFSHAHCPAGNPSLPRFFQFSSANANHRRSQSHSLWRNPEGCAGQASLPSTTVGVTFAIYKQQDGGAAIWLETQNVTTDAAGNYSVLLGSTTATGLPSDLFSQQEQRWLGVQMQGQAEQPRVLLVSVPYAFKAVEATNWPDTAPASLSPPIACRARCSNSCSSKPRWGVPRPPCWRPAQVRTVGCWRLSRIRPRTLPTPRRTRSCW